MRNADPAVTQLRAVAQELVVKQPCTAARMPGQVELLVVETVRLLEQLSVGILNTARRHDKKHCETLLARAGARNWQGQPQPQRRYGENEADTAVRRQESKPKRC